MKKLLVILSLLTVLSGFSHPQIALAEDSYTLLAPIPLEGTNGGETKQVSKFDTSYVNGVIALIIGLIGVLAVVAVVVGGFQYVSSATLGGKTSGRETIQNALIGLGLAISSYLILNSLNPALLNFDLKIKTLPPPGKIDTDLTQANPSSPTKDTPQPTAIPDTAGISPAQGPTDVAWADDSIDRGKFGVGINFNAPNCAFVGQPNCTSLAQISDTVVSNITFLESKCDCSIVITGGTEYWNHDGHNNDMSLNKSPHKPGGSVLDLRLEDKPGTMSDFIRKNGTPATGTGCTKGTERYTYNGSLYVNEVGLPQETGGHWHVCFQ
jgi:hypothetical protein